MDEIRDLINEVRKRPDCKVYSPSGLPIIAEAHVLPSDLIEFYALCGGLSLYENADYSAFIVPPNEVVLANPKIACMSRDELLAVDEEFWKDSISWDWYTIAHDGNGDFLTIDLHPYRLGRCYDSFHETHALIGDSSIIATSFTDLLRRLLANEGRYWYWLERDFVSLGDAYD